MQHVALFLGNHVDAHRLFQRDAVVVDEALGFVAAVGPFGDGRAHPRLADLEQARITRQHFVLAVFADELLQPPFAKPIGAELAADVADHQFRRPAVGGDDAFDVGVLFKTPLIAHRR
jgi:hypothetical protein